MARMKRICFRSSVGSVPLFDQEFEDTELHRSSPRIILSAGSALDRQRPYGAHAQLAESKEPYSVRLFSGLSDAQSLSRADGNSGGNLSQCTGRLMTAHTVYFNKRH
jgi:hypothetical protein